MSELIKVESFSRIFESPLIAPLLPLLRRVLRSSFDIAFPREPLPIAPAVARVMPFVLFAMCSGLKNGTRSAIVAVPATIAVEMPLNVVSRSLFGSFASEISIAPSAEPPLIAVEKSCMNNAMSSIAVFSSAVSVCVVPAAAAVAATVLASRAFLNSGRVDDDTASVIPAELPSAEDLMKSAIIDPVERAGLRPAPRDVPFAVASRMFFI